MKTKIQKGKDPRDLSRGSSIFIIPIIEMVKTRHTVFL
jgi:hypothetical protein